MADDSRGSESEEVLKVGHHAPNNKRRAATHIAWDSFTHAGRGVVAHVPALSAPVLQVGGVDIGVYKVLQHGSTVVGLAVLVYVAARAVRRLEPSMVAGTELPAQVRKGILIVLASAMLVGAILGGVAGRGDGEFVRQVQLGGARAAVVALAVFAAGVLVYGIAFTMVEHRVTRRGL